ncbi:hypothetical protein ABFY61_05640 [Lysinibacillus pakistanensis]
MREALRSLELLGLIETRHGGGTFLASTQKHRRTINCLDVLREIIITSEIVFY